VTDLQARQLTVMAETFPAWEIRLADLAETFPAWDIRRDRPQTYWWTATRRVLLSREERDAKIKYLIVRSTPERLRDVLTEQIELLHQLRGVRHNFTTNQSRIDAAEQADRTADTPPLPCR